MQFSYLGGRWLVLLKEGYIAVQGILHKLTQLVSLHAVSVIQHISASYTEKVSRALQHAAGLHPPGLLKGHLAQDTASFCCIMRHVYH